MDDSEREYVDRLQRRILELEGEVIDGERERLRGRARIEELETEAEQRRPADPLEAGDQAAQFIARYGDSPRVAAYLAQHGGDPAPLHRLALAGVDLPELFGVAS